MTQLNLCAIAIWQTMRQEAHQASVEQPLTARFLDASIISHDDFSTAISSYLAAKLASAALSAAAVSDIFKQAIDSNPLILKQMLRDLLAHKQRDPTCTHHITAFLYFKGYHSVQIYRIMHWLWQQKRCLLASYFQSQLASQFDVDIHPAATLGAGVILDHATGFVIGETAVIGDDVSIMHNVTLGGSGAYRGDRHPKICRGVLLSTGAKLFGNIEVGEGAKVGAGSLVLKSVPAHVTVAGVPAKIIGRVKSAMPALDMDHRIEADIADEEKTLYESISKPCRRL